MPFSPRGSQWNRWDLHFHTPSSYDYKDKSVTDEEIVQALVDAGVSAVAITDHHVMDVTRIRNIQRIAKDRLLVLPGIELRCELGGKESVHFIGIFPEDCDLEETWNKLSVKVKVTPGDVRKLGNEHVYCAFKESARVIAELGGIVTIHGHGKASSIEGIGNFPNFKAQLKTDLLNDFVDVVEVGAADRQEEYTKIVFPAVGTVLPIILGSDNHNAKNYAASSPCWLRCDLSFRGLKMVLQEPRERVFIGDAPEDLIRVEQNKSRYIRSIAFKKNDTAKTSDAWFDGEVEFSPGLVAIIGNKGSGKSALADAIGLLGGTRNSTSFSFLNADRFCHPTGGHAQDFSATMVWESNSSTTKGLSDQVGAGDVEQVKYLPQSYVETICNEIVGVDEGIFERELKAVIFSHVPEAERLGQPTLDDLIEFQTREKQRRVDSLLKDLRDVSRTRAKKESDMSPLRRQELEKQLAAKREELDLLDKAKPTLLPNPADGDLTSGDPDLLKELTIAEDRLKALNERYTIGLNTLSTAERKAAVANNLLEKLANLDQEFASLTATLAEPADELGIDPKTLATIKINTIPVSALKLQADKDISALKIELDAQDPPGLKQQIQSTTSAVTVIRSKLGEPTRLYQQSVAQLAIWQKKREELVGQPTQVESLSGLESLIAALNGYPAQVEDLRKKQLEIARQIHIAKAGQADVLRKLYGPVQTFIDTHDIAKDKLHLDFRVDLIDTGFTPQLLGLLALNRKGSFMGTDEGRERSEALVKATQWQDEESVAAFLSTVDESLHVDKRSEPLKQVQLAEQVLSGHRPEEVYNQVYGLEYLRPRYLLRWDGKDIGMLSPGERGTLLLTFYLLIDQSDLPLIIDQPEGNLDNHTVAKVLVECIRVARKRRQVFIVTHNPNLAVVCDADQVIHARLTKSSGNSIEYTSGSLENPIMSTLATDVLEGTRWAFDVRGDKYDVGSSEVP